MKTRFMKAIVICLFVIMNQQVQPVLASNFHCDEGISEVVRNNILEVVNATLNHYCSSGNFWDEDDSKFDNDKYGDFVKLFSGKAEVVDDIYFTKKKIHYSEYAEIIYNHFQENGVPFRIDKAIIKSIDIDESGFFVIDVSFRKRLFTGLNENGDLVKLKSGRALQLNMRIDLPDYLLTDARIQYIQIDESNKVMDLIKKPFVYVGSLVKRKM